MFTIYDYLKYYKDSKLSDIRWNVMDNLVCTILSYLPVDGFDGIKNIDEFYNYANKFDRKSKNSLMVESSYKILDLIFDCNRYKNLKLSNFQIIRNEDVQFGAVTFRIEDNTIVVYKGTDNSLIGWIENFRLSYSYPTYTQKIALTYLENNISLFRDKNVYVVGHSKGGNLALTAAMECKKYIYDKIVKIFNFDGPGLRYKEYKSEKYNRIKEKLVNYVPTGSIVGMLLENEDYHVVKSNEKAWNEHHPTSWLLFGEYFLEGRLSKFSEDLHTATSINMRNLDQKKIEQTFETIFKNMEKEYRSDFKFTYADLRKFSENMKNVDPEIYTNMEKIITAITTNYKKKENH